MKIFKKRGLVLALVLMLLLATAAGAVTGCKQDAEERWMPGTPLDKNDVTIAIIHVDDGTGGYSYAHDFGVREAQRALGLSEDQIIRKLNINDSDAIMIEAAMREAIAEGANIIIATSWGHMDACEKLSEEYPRVVFAHATGHKHNGTNLTNYFGRVYQARYLSGIAAGIKTQTGKIGFVAAHGTSNSEVTGGLNSFAMGVEYVNPDAQIFVSVTYSWYDPAGERLAAQKLIAEGCDVIAQHVNTSTPQIEAENAGIWGIGYNTDMSIDAPNAVLTSVIWNWGAYYTFLISSVIDGSFTTEPYYGGLAEGIIDITPLNDALSAPQMETEIGAARERILGGDFNVFDGIIETNDGRTVGTQGGTLADDEIVGGIDWYYRNITELG